ncbi:9559_t:CDS:2 [Funneliformis geosporum]|nr:9559_t:CDS:2 [Funneliformis geosporum]
MLQNKKKKTVKNYQKREELKKKGKDYSNQTNEDYKRIDDKTEQNNPPPSTDKFNAKCEDCGIEIEVGSHCTSCFEKKTKPNNSRNGDNSDKSNLPLPPVKFSDSNASQDKIFHESLEEMKSNGGKGIIFPTNISPKQRIFLEVINDARLGRYSGENRLDYDKLKLSESEKKELYSLLKNLGVSVNSSRSFGDDGPIQQSGPFLSKHI